MYKKLNPLLERLSKIHYNDYGSYQKYSINKVSKYIEPFKYTAVFKNLINSFKNDKNISSKTTKYNNKKNIIPPRPIENILKKKEFKKDSPLFTPK